MIKRELIVNIKSFIICLAILIVMFLMVYLIYPFIITEETVNQMDEMMKMFPEEFIKAFNMDMSSISTVYGWIKTEGLMFMMITIGIYASILGGNIILKEENDKTIEYLAFLPIKRSKILTNKLIVSIICIVALVILFGLFNFIALLISGDFDKKQFILLSICPLFTALPLFALCLFLSTFMHKTKGVVGIGLGLVILFYFLNVLSELSDKVEFMKYFSLYSLSDTRNIIENTKISFVCILISLVLSAIFIVLTYYRYNKKELI